MRRSPPCLVRGPVLVVAVAAVLLSAMTLPARADTAAQLASWFDVKLDAVREVAGFELPAGGDYTHVLLGRYQQDGVVLGAAVIMRCDAGQCTGARIRFHAADRVELHGLFDLNGAPGPLPSARQLGGGRSYRKLEGAGGGRRPAWPALVLYAETSRQSTGPSRSGTQVSGTDRRGRIHVVSLLRADERVPTVLAETSVELHPTGAGMTTAFRTERGASKDALDLVGRQQRQLDRTSRCRRPDPVDVRYVLKDRRYQLAALPAGRSGC